MLYWFKLLRKQVLLQAMLSVPLTSSILYLLLIMLSGYLSAFGFIVLLMVGLYCFGYAARRSSLLHVLLLETLLGLFIITLILVSFYHISIAELFTKPTVDNYLWLSAAALFGFAGGNYFTLLNLKTAGEKVNSLLSPAITACVVLLSVVVFNEVPGTKKWIGTILTLGTVITFLLKGKKEANATQISKIGWMSGAATVICISVAIVASIKGATTGITLMHSIWLRLLFALVIVAAVFLVKRENKNIRHQSYSFYAAVAVGTIAQTVIANFLWLHASFELGIAVFQVIIASFPLWVYAADVYIFKRSSPSIYFLLSAFVAVAGIVIIMM